MHTIGSSHPQTSRCWSKLLFLTGGWLNPWMQNPWVWRANHIEKNLHISLDCVVQGSAVYTKKYVFGFLEFPAFLMGCWHNCVSTLYRALDIVDEGQVAQEHHEFTSHGGESQFFHSTSEVPGPLPAESGSLKKVRLHFQHLAAGNKHFNEVNTEVKPLSYWKTHS